MEASSGRQRPASWVEDGEKYALVGLNVELDGNITQGAIACDLWVLTETTFSLPAYWSGWLGTHRAKQVENCKLFLVSRLPSVTPDILDDENDRLKRRVWHWYYGLLLASTFGSRNKPVILTGSRREGEIGLRQQLDLDAPIHQSRYRPVKLGELKLAAQLGQNLQTLTAAPPNGSAWRLFRTLHIYLKTRTIKETIDRIHQYCRCIEGLILPKAGDTKSQFKSRTELFIGPKHHDRMGAIYDVRSAVEHLHEDRYLDNSDRQMRLDLMEKGLFVEHVARMALVRIVGDCNLWSHFANRTALSAFWALPQAERRRIWGDPIDPMDALTDFDPKRVHNADLGLS